MKRKLIIAAVVTTFGLFLLSMSASKQSTLGITDRKLSDLPESPNAVSTQTIDESRRLPSLDFSTIPLDKVITAVAYSIESMPRSQIIDQTENYIHAEFRSLIFRFADDVEFFLDSKSSQIHFRSASRIGHSDLGANSRRMQKLSIRIQERLDILRTGSE